MKLEKKMERRLHDILSSGVATDAGIKAWAKQLAEIAYNHQRAHPRNMRGG